MSDDNRDDPSTAIRSRGPEAGVAALMLGIAVLVITDSLRVGIGWAEDGPRSGYFPFYIGLLLAGASSWTWVTQLLHWRQSTEEFATRKQVGLVVSVFVPMVIYVGLIFVLGIYLASAMLIGYFMVRHGRYKPALAATVAIGVPLIFFAVFEKWFLVPLPKGPIEQLLGL